MADFSKYFLMIREDDPEGTAKDIIAYTLEKTKGQIDWDEETMKAVIPSAHGNINHVCRVSDDSGHSIYIKQAGLETRISKDMTASIDRNTLESEMLILEDKWAPGMVPKIFFYDTTMYACGMEDCSDYEVMRDVMLRYEPVYGFADSISTFMAKTLVNSSDIVMDHREKKKLVQKFITPDLCDITEKLVLMEPYLGADRNNIYEPDREFVEKELYQDEALHLAVAKLKFRFMTDAQALLHGDLHTGSIFVKKQHEGDIKVFDCEFGTYAPMGYDVGNIIANIIFAFAAGAATGHRDFARWCLDTIENISQQFAIKFMQEYEDNVTEPMAEVKGFEMDYLHQVMRDTAGYAGTELHRRIVGMANVADITSLTDEKARLRAERTCILVGKQYILHPDSFWMGTDFRDAVMGAWRYVTDPIIDEKDREKRWYAIPRTEEDTHIIL